MANKKDLSKKKENVIIQSANLFFRNGYVNTGLNEILEVCNIPKGSLYYYFKDELLLNVIEYQTKRILDLFDNTVDDLSIFKLKSFFSIFLNNIAIIEIENDNQEKENNENSLFGNIEENTIKFYGGSPLGNLNAELSNLSNEINEKISDSFKQIENRIYLFLETLSCVHEKYRSDYTEFYTYLLINNLEGSCLKLKREQSLEPVDEFLKFFDILIEKMIND